MTVKMVATVIRVIDTPNMSISVPIKDRPDRLDDMVETAKDWLLENPSVLSVRIEVGIDIPEPGEGADPREGFPTAREF